MKTEIESKATPRPWKIEIKEDGVLEVTYWNQADCIDEIIIRISSPMQHQADCWNFIVRAVNAHEALLKAAKETEKLIEAYIPYTKEGGYADDAKNWKVIDGLRKAIALAKGGE